VGYRNCGYPAISFPTVSQHDFRAVWYKRKTRYLVEITGFYLIAGACNHQNLRSRGNHGVDTAGFEFLVSQALMVAEFGSRLKLLFRAAA
jgi:hypothetical protein